jgi:hypothetical protein
MVPGLARVVWARACAHTSDAAQSRLGTRREKEITARQKSKGVIRVGKDPATQVMFNSRKGEKERAVAGSDRPLTDITPNYYA